MKPVLIQNLLKRNKKRSIDIDPSKDEIEKTATSIFNWALVALAIIVIVSIAVGA
jgi:hypothetical protein